MQIEALFNNFKKEVFRLELLSSYAEKSEQEQFQKFKEGKAIKPDKETKEFLRIIKKFSKEGKKIIRAHVIPKRLTDYLRFEIKTGYIPQSKAGAQVYLVNCEDYKKLLEKGFKPNDFWLFDDNKVVELVYGKKGRFIKERVIGKKHVKKYVALKEAILDNATPLANN